MADPFPAAAEHPTRDQEQTTIGLLRLVLTPGVGTRKAHRILEGIGGWARAKDLPIHKTDDLRKLGLEPHIAGAVLADRSLRRAEEEWRKASDSKTHLIPIGHPLYPRLLMETSDPPLVLFVRGSSWDPDRPHVAIVGARGASAYGLGHARALAQDLASRGAVVASGLARGIDRAAHEGALDVSPDTNPVTTAVLGSGVDVCYPSENRWLLDAIIQRGSLVSEFPLGTPPLPAHFPLRNRIIAGMSWGTVVVEARERSGSLITARLAAEANREVFAVPGPLDLEQSRGTHRLIRDGACLVTSADEIVAEFPPHIRNALSRSRRDEVEAHEFGVDTSLSGAENAVLEAMSTWKTISIDQLIEGLNLSVHKVYAALTRLELEGLIDTLPGDRYVRKR